MKTQLLITVKNAGLYTRLSSSLLWFLNFSKKSEINVWIDSQNCTPVTLVARAQPYELELTPGTHIIYFDDPKRAYRVKSNSFWKKFYLGLFGFAAGAVAGNFGDLATAMNSAGYFAGGQRAEVRENVLRCTLEPGTELPVTVKPLRLKVRVKIGK